MWQWIAAIAIAGGAAASSVKIVEQGNEALIERLGQYNKKLEPGLNFLIPGIDRVAFRETVREKVIDVPPQNCITRDNVSVAADAVIYWRIVDMEKAYYKIQNLQAAILNLALAQSFSSSSLARSSAEILSEKTPAARGAARATMARARMVLNRNVLLSIRLVDGPAGPGRLTFAAF